MKVERYVLVGSKPELVTLVNGETVSMHSYHSPLDLRKDSKFARLRKLNRLKKVMVPIEPDPVSLVQQVTPAPAPARELDSDQSSSDEPEPELFELLVSLGLGSRVASILSDAGIDLDGLRSMSDEDLLSLNGIGPQSVQDIRSCLE